ncbi:hypothetical protein C8R44DRAFT_754736 [Mycena epipterygia]|nr:hypothetical protein C8R44DRAFT_754736 [Mycena epipterygia]
MWREPSVAAGDFFFGLIRRAFEACMLDGWSPQWGVHRIPPNFESERANLRITCSPAFLQEFLRPCSVHIPPRPSLVLSNSHWPTPASEYPHLQARVSAGAFELLQGPRIRLPPDLNLVPELVRLTDFIPAPIPSSNKHHGLAPGKNACGPSTSLPAGAIASWPARKRKRRQGGAEGDGEVLRSGSAGGWWNAPRAAMPASICALFARRPWRVNSAGRRRDWGGGSERVTVDVGEGALARELGSAKARRRTHNGSRRRIRAPPGITNTTKFAKLYAFHPD